MIALKLQCFLCPEVCYVKLCHDIRLAPSLYDYLIQIPTGNMGNMDDFMVFSVDSIRQCGAVSWHFGVSKLTISHHSTSVIIVFLTYVLVDLQMSMFRRPFNSFYHILVPHSSHHFVYTFQSGSPIKFTHQRVNSNR